ncbi:MAG: hypothetical protein M3R48_09945 [Candidatus Dormibacteraeota bacterium]|nr:hypothetical protein [Candidatus Dormibacteraeota bacterium]
MQQFLDALRSQPTIGLALLTAVLALMCAVLLARIERLKDRLHVARSAAEDAARAAALAAPGGIDADIVLDLLRLGERPTLDTVYAAMHHPEADSQAG